MEILVLSPKYLYPPNDGGALGVLSMLKGFKQNGVNVHLICVSTNKHKAPAQLHNELLQLATVDTVFINTDVNVKDAFFNLFSKQSYNIQRFISNDFKRKIMEVLNSKTFDVVQFEGLYMAPYAGIVKEHSNAKMVLRAHNVEHHIWEDLANEQGTLKKVYFNVLSQRLKAYEENVRHNFDAICTITSEDEDYFKSLNGKAKTFFTPFMIDADSYKVKVERDLNSVGFIGALDWMPNLKALDWLLAEVWPLVLKQNSNLELKVAGRNMPSEYVNRKISSVKFLGEVENAKTFISSCGVLAVPLFSGSGVRVKIIEALALNTPVVATTIATDGLNAGFENYVEVADLPQAFANAIVDSLIKTNQLSANYVETQYGEKAVAAKHLNQLKLL